MGKWKFQKCTELPEVTLPGIVLELRIKLGPVSDPARAFAANVNHTVSGRKCLNPSHSDPCFLKADLRKKKWGGGGD